MSEAPDSAKSYIVKWHDEDAGQYLWFIRGIHSDGSFYGDVTAYNERRQFDIVGTLSAVDFDRLPPLIEQLEKEPHDANDNRPWRGLLAESPMEHPRIIFTYYRGMDHATKAELMFREMIGILTPYLRSFY